MKKIAYIVGTRPNYVKLCQLSKFFKTDKFNKNIVIDTGQHYSKQLSNNFFKEFKISKPAYILNKKKRINSDIIFAIYSKLPKILKTIRPDKVVVFGDTNSSLAGAICSHFLDIPVIHIEAGVRSYDKNSIEEKNRFIIDQLSKIHIVPTYKAKKNLIKENIDKKNIFFCGDIMLDHFYQNKKVLKKNTNFNKFIFVTLHRSENVDSKKKLNKILKCLSNIKKKIIFAIHPRTLNNIKKFNLKIGKNIKVVPPLSYKETLINIYNSEFVFTDSGGLQKESFFLKKRCIVFRDKTEWREIIYPGANMILNTNLDVKTLKQKILNFKSTFVSEKKNIFGSKRISFKIYQKIIK